MVHRAGIRSHVQRRPVPRNVKLASAVGFGGERQHGHRYGETLRKAASLHRAPQRTAAAHAQQHTAVNESSCIVQHYRHRVSSSADGISAGSAVAVVGVSVGSRTNANCYSIVRRRVSSLSQSLRSNTSCSSCR
jgi:hypothetical protein